MGRYDDDDEHGPGRLNIEQQWKLLGLVVDQCNEIDHTMGQIIATYVKPAANREGFVTKYMLHNSVINFGNKIHLILQIAKQTQGPNVDGEALRKVSQLRNAVAHAPLMKGLRVNVNALAEAPYGAYLVVETMQSGMRFTERTREEVAMDFMEAEDKARKGLDALLEHVKHLTS